MLQKIILAALKVNNTLQNSKVLLFHTDTSETLAPTHEGKNETIKHDLHGIIGILATILSSNTLYPFFSTNDLI